MGSEMCIRDSFNGDIINEIARNNPKDKLTQRSYNNQEGSHMSNKKEVEKKNKKAKRN